MNPICFDTPPQQAVCQLDVSFSGIELTTGDRTTHSSLWDCPTFADNKLQTLRIFCNCLHDCSRFYTAPEQKTEATIRQFQTVLRSLEGLRPERVEFYLCSQERFSLYNDFVQHTSLFAAATEVILSFGTAECYLCALSQLHLPQLPNAEKLVLILEKNISCSLLHPLQAPKLQTLTLLQLPDAHHLRLPSERFPHLQEVKMGLCEDKCSPPREQDLPTIYAHQFPPTVKTLVIENTAVSVSYKVSLQGGEALEELQTKHVLLLSDSLHFGKQLKMLRFSDIDTPMLTCLPRLNHCIIDNLFFHSRPFAQDLLAPRLQTLKFDPEDAPFIPQHIPNFFDCFIEESAGTFRPVIAPPPKPDPAILHVPRYQSLSIILCLTPSGESLIRLFCTDHFSPNQKKIYFSATEAERMLTERLYSIDLTVYLCDELTKNDNAVYYEGGLHGLLDWMAPLAYTKEFTLTYLPDEPEPEPAWLEPFIPVMQQFSRQLQQSSFLQHIESLCLKDYFTPSPTTFSLPNLKRLRLFWDLDIDWNSVTQWNAPQLEQLSLDGVKHFPDLPDLMARFPKLEHLRLRSQRHTVLDDFASPIPRYQNLHIPPQLKSLSIDYADIEGLQTDAPCQLRCLEASNCHIPSSLLLQMPHLERLSLDGIGVAEPLPALNAFPHLREVCLDSLSEQQLHIFKGCHTLQEVWVDLGHSSREDEMRSNLLFLFELEKIRSVKLYERRWDIQDVVAQCPELLVRFFPDTNYLYGLKRYALLDGSV